MPITHTNRQGVTYYLCQGTTKGGRPRYYFSRERRDTSPNAVPNGYVVTESVNGVVSLCRAQEATFHPDEVAAVRNALEAHPQPGNYRVAVKKDHIEVYERVGIGGDDLVREFVKEGFVPFGGIKAVLAERERRARFAAILRFGLVDTNRRFFTVDRMTFRGDERWLMVGGPRRLATLLKEVIPKLGTEAFFELF